MRQDLQARLPDSPDRFLAFFKDKVVYYLFIEKLFSHALCYCTGWVDDLSFHPHAWLFEYVLVVVWEESFGLFRCHIRSHLWYQVNRYYFALFILVSLEFKGQPDNLGPLFPRQLMGNLSQQNTSFFPDLKIFPNIPPNANGWLVWWEVR